MNKNTKKEAKKEAVDILTTAINNNNSFIITTNNVNTVQTITQGNAAVCLTMAILSCVTAIQNFNEDERETIEKAVARIIEKPCVEAKHYKIGTTPTVSFNDTSKEDITIRGVETTLRQLLGSNETETEWDEEDVWESIRELSGIRAKYSLFKNRTVGKHHACGMGIKALRRMIGAD